MYNLLFFVGFSGFIFFSCFKKTENKKISEPANQYYNLSSPEKTHILPRQLKEISGIQYISESSIACVQDEKGKIFFFNPQSSKIENIIPFAEGGDYEDLVKAGDVFFVLRNDGTLFRYSSSGTTVLGTPLSSKNNTESLCLDKENNRLILGCKNGEKSFYAFNLEKLTFMENPIFTIGEKRFYPTAICIHPVTKEFYILSKEKILIVNKEGKVAGELALSSSLFPQPEGLSFKENGDMLISNEGKGHHATILEFKYKANEK